MKRYLGIALRIVLIASLSLPVVLAQGPGQLLTAPTSSAQTLSQLLGPSIQSPNMTCVPNSLVCTYSGGYVYAGNGPVLVNPGSLTLTGSATTCARPGYTSCDFIYYTSGTTLATTQSLLTAYASGNSVLAMATTSSTGVLTIQGTFQDTYGLSGNTSFTDGYYWIECRGGASANQQAFTSGQINASSLNGPMVIGTALQTVPVWQVATTGTTSTHQYVCPLFGPAGRTTAGKGISITSVAFFYGVQTTTLGTQAAVLASGTFNGSLVFSDVQMPTAGGSASTVTPVRLDSGTLTINPVAASIQGTTTTQGAFYNATFTPATPIPLTTSLQYPLFSVTLQGATTAAEVTNTPGAIVFYTLTPQ